MILHAGGEKYEISPDNILNVEAIAVKKKIGKDFQPWMDAMAEFDVEALTAFVWIAKKRMEPTTRFEDISFPLSSIEFETTPEEDAAIAEATGPKVEGESSPVSE